MSYFLRPQTSGPRVITLAKGRQGDKARGKWRRRGRRTEEEGWRKEVLLALDRAGRDAAVGQ